jgi:hypothetical protein
MACRNPAEPNSDKCARRHNGNARRGMDSATYQSKGWSKALPQRLLDRIGELCASPDWNNLNQKILHVNVRLSELAEKLHGYEGTPGADWIEFNELFTSLKAAIMVKDDDKVENYLNRMKEIAKIGSKKIQIEQQQVKLFDKKARLIS